MSIGVFDGFKFSRLDSPIHRLDPRAKFVMTVGVFALTLLFTNVLVQLLLFAGQVPIIKAARAIRRWLASMRAGALLGALIFITNLLFGSSLSFSVAMTVRFINILTAFSLFFMTTSPDDLGLAMEQARIPYTFSFTFTTAVRLVPTMAIDAQTVMDAQRSRGLELDKGRFLTRIRNYIPVLIPLIVAAIRRSIELAEALESRAFGASSRRQHLVTLTMKISDYAVIAATLAALFLSIYVYLYLPLPDIGLPHKLPSPWP